MTTHRQEHPTPLVNHLEPHQFTAHTHQPVARAILSSRVQAGLWVLRVFVIIVSVMVIYTFISQL